MLQVVLAVHSSTGDSFWPITLEYLSKWKENIPANTHFYRRTINAFTAERLPSDLTNGSRTSLQSRSIFLFYVRYFWCFMFIDSCFSCFFPRDSTVPVEPVSSNSLTDTNSRLEAEDLTHRSISALNESMSPPKYVLSLLPSYEDRQNYPPGSPPPRYKKYY